MGEFVKSKDDSNQHLDEHVVRSRVNIPTEFNDGDDDDASSCC